MNYCKICLNVDTRPGSKFVEKNLCSPCFYFKKNINTDYNSRIKFLMDLIKKFPKYPRRRYDCIIGVSGGKDSTRQALWIRDKLKLRPLLVCLGYPPEQLTDVGANNLSNLINLGFDVHTIFLSPVTWKKLVKKSFFEYSNYLKHSEQAIIAAVPRLAIRYKIPIIFWGENPGEALGDLNTMGSQGYDGNNLKYMNTVGGGKLDWLLKDNYNLNKIFPFEYPSSKEFQKFKIQIIYLSWFWSDWSIINNAEYALVEGLEVRKDTLKNTSDIWGVFSLDEDWVTFNQMFKYYKYGFGRVSDYVNEEIRLGRMSRDEGIYLVEKYDGTVSKKYVNSFCKYINIKKKEFWDVVYSTINKNLFKFDNKRKITKKFKVGTGLIND